MVQKKRHVAKALSWRMLGTLDTIILSWIITGDMMVGLSIGVFETISKTFLYYIHERAWYRMSDFGIEERNGGRKN